MPVFPVSRRGLAAACLCVTLSATPAASATIDNILLFQNAEPLSPFGGSAPGVRGSERIGFDIDNLTFGAGGEVCDPIACVATAGAYAELTINAEAGLQFDYEIGGSAYGGLMQYKTSFETPAAGSFAPGAMIDLAPSQDFIFGQLSTTSPNINTSLDLYSDINIRGKLTASFVDLELNESGTIFDIDETFNIFETNGTEVSLLSDLVESPVLGTLPRFFPAPEALSFNAASLETNLKLVWLPPTAVGIDVSVQPEGLPEVAFATLPGGLLLDLFEGELNAPVAQNTVTAFSEDQLAVAAKDDLHNLSVDMDSFFGPSGSQNVALGPVEAKLTWWDVMAGIDTDYFAELSLDPRIYVRLFFSNPVRVNGVETPIIQGWLDELPSFEVFTETQVLSLFDLGGVVNFRDGLNIAPEITIEGLSASLTVFGLGPEIGPLFSETLRVDELGQDIVFNDVSSAVGGFTTFPGRPFTLSPCDTYYTTPDGPVCGVMNGGPTAVPLPAGVWLALTGAAARRRAGRRRRAAA